MAAVLAGPSVTACYGSPEGLGACLRQRIVDFGLLPPAEPEVIVAAPQDAPAAIAPVPPDVPEAPSVAALPPALTLLRAEPDGSLVIAGTGSPGAGIAVYADGEPLGLAKAEPSGDWVVVPEAHLAPGGVEITVGEAGSAELSERSFVVVIDPDRTSEPLVIASKPGAASDVLQGLPRRNVAPAAAPAAEPAAKADAAPAPAAAEAAPAPATEPDMAIAAFDPEPETPPRSAAETPAPAEPRPVPVEPEPVEPEPAEAAPAPATEPDMAIAAFDPEPETPPRSAAETPAPAELQPVPIEPEPVEPEPVNHPDARDATIAAAEPQPIEPEAPAATVAPPVVVPPSIDAIEIDGSANFFAGGGIDGATIRLYVDDTFIADAKVAEGRWLVEAAGVLTQPSQRVRVDMLRPGSAEVAARAEVNFVIDVPAAEHLPVAESPPPAAESAVPAGESAPPASELEVQPAQQPVPAIIADPFDRELAPAADAAPTPAPDRDLAAAPDAAPAGGAERDLTMAAGAVPNQGDQRDLAGAGEAVPAPSLDRDLAASVKSPPRVADVPDLGQVPKEAGHTEDKLTESGVASVPEAAVTRPPPATTPAAPAPIVAAPTKPAVPAEQPSAPQTAAIPTAPAAKPRPAVIDSPSFVELAPPENTVPTLTAIPVGDPDAQRFASGKAIIRRGDNLWSIARRVYGDGLKYTTIYRANKEQIRRPSRIYPGQVFDLPVVYDE